MVPSGEYFDGEQGCGGNTGCLLVISATALIVLGTMLVKKVKHASDNIHQKPKTEIMSNVNKYSVGIDTIKIGDTIKTR